MRRPLSPFDCAQRAPSCPSRELVIQAGAEKLGLRSQPTFSGVSGGRFGGHAVRVTWPALRSPRDAGIAPPPTVISPVGDAPPASQAPGCLGPHWPHVVQIAMASMLEKLVITKRPRAVLLAEGRSVLGHSPLVGMDLVLRCGARVGARDHPPPVDAPRSDVVRARAGLGRAARAEQSATHLRQPAAPARRRDIPSLDAQLDDSGIVGPVSVTGTNTGLAFAVGKHPRDQ